MKNKKGSLLLIIIVVVAVISILAIPVIYMINQNSELTAKQITSQKANEVAYAGYKIVERYIIDDRKSASPKFSTYLVEGDTPNVKDTFYTTLNIPYNKNGDTILTNVKAVASFEGEVLKEVFISSTATFSVTTETYESNLVFGDNSNSISINASRVFPTNNYFDTQVAEVGNGNNKEELIGGYSVEKMLTRMDVREVPNIGDLEHREYLKRYSNYYQSNPQPDSYILNDDAVKNIITTLENQERWDSSLHVVYLDTATSVLVAPNKNEINIDLTDLGLEGEDDINLVFITNSHYVFGTQKTGGGLTFNVTGGNVYFIYNNDADLQGYLNSTSPENKGQVTIATTSSGSKNIMFDNSNMPMNNIFFYTPLKTVDFTASSSRNVRGAIISDGIRGVDSIDAEFDTWRGLEQILGYNLIEINP